MLRTEGLIMVHDALRFLFSRWFPIRTHRADYVDLNLLPDSRRPNSPPWGFEVARRGVAFHEAGHAVVGMTRGMRLKRIRLLEERLRRLGQRVRLSGATTWCPGWVDEIDFAVQCAAGAVAEQAYFESAGLLTPDTASLLDAAHDRDLAVAALARSGFELVLSGPAPAGGASWPAIVQQAARDVERLWGPITAVADALADTPRGLLESADVVRVASLSNPSPGTR
ncbi:hypothetical protein AB0N77_21535 [Streptomyces misionensis]|uniref:hypothetical protein n=1 Tax=Streptomyces misionensis TaxID=67331 RepID=UPI0034408547